MKNSILVLFAIFFAGQAWGQEQSCTWNGTSWQNGVSLVSFPGHGNNCPSDATLNGSFYGGSVACTKCYATRKEYISSTGQQLTTEQVAQQQNQTEGNKCNGKWLYCNGQKTNVCVVGSIIGNATGCPANQLATLQSDNQNNQQQDLANNVKRDDFGANMDDNSNAPGKSHGVDLSDPNNRSLGKNEQQANDLDSSVSKIKNLKHESSGHEDNITLPNGDKVTLTKGENGAITCSGECSSIANSDGVLKDNVNLSQLKKADKAQRKLDQKEAKKQANAYDMTQKNTTGYGGSYGGASKQDTQALNQGAQQVTGLMNQVMVATTSNQNTNVNTNYAANSMTNTQADYNNAQAKMMKNNGKANIMMGIFEGVVAMTQEGRAVQHTLSIGKVTKTRGDAENWIKANAKTQAETDALRKNTDDNWNAEKKAQQAAASAQHIVAGTTAANAALTIYQGIKLQQAANTIATQPTPTGPQFTIGSNDPMANPTPDQNALTDPGAVVDNDDTTVPDASLPTDGLDPNMPTGPVASQSPSQGGMGAPATPQGDSGMGLGSAGGTSAANDDKKADTSALTKNAEGTYSPSDDAGSKFSRAGGMGGGAGVGLDNGFADLLKKFLPGGDDEKKGQDNLNFGSDRSPASDQAAVLGRNQNIFEAIHKRYEKKQAEGAIIFAGDKG